METKEYIVNTILGAKVCCDSEEAAETILDEVGEEIYDEVLRETYGDVKVCGYEYDPARTFKGIDPIAYRCGMLDYCDSIQREVRDELERMEVGDRTKIFGIPVNVEAC